ncbi:hypothetical protein O181_095258 [Austropuccinia psidii MF-1]|uniref:Uncharacterized protein n=1 Tax=Austropuccinia psidii MF-1 TaxID=1389203 RepID=A0A9Q3PB09_9BASI|nr:hypothetical protein [Austropuccinia psidii MF-1]
MRTSIGRYNTHSTGDNMKNQILEAKETHDSEFAMTTGFHNCESPNQYAENSPKPPDRKGMTTRNLLAQGHMNHTNTSKKTGRSHQ